MILKLSMYQIKETRLHDIKVKQSDYFTLNLRSLCKYSDIFNLRNRFLFKRSKWYGFMKIKECFRVS